MTMATTTRTRGSRQPKGLLSAPSWMRRLRLRHQQCASAAMTWQRCSTPTKSSGPPMHEHSAGGPNRLVASAKLARGQSLY